MFLAQTISSCQRDTEPEVRNTWSDVDEQVLAISTSEITAAEVKQDLGQLKNNRSPGEDLITGEMLKILGEVELENNDISPQLCGG